MPPELTPGVTPPVVPPAAPPPAGDPPPATQETPEQLRERLTRAEAALRAANAESADRRRKLDAFEKAESDRAAAALSETEKLTKRATDAEAHVADALKLANERLIRAEVIARAATLKFSQPDDALALIDRSKLVVGADGAVAGVEEQLKALAAAKPYLLARAGQPNLNPGNPGGAGEVQLTDRQKLDKLYGANGASQIFDARWASARDGGVIIGKNE